jgi:hypothetical protein
VPPWLRRLIEAVAVFAIALAGVIALLLFFEGRDAPTTNADRAPAASGPGVLDPKATSSLLRAGNVELRYARKEDRNALVAFSQRAAGTDTSALREIGGAIVVVRDPNVAGVVARAYKRRLQLASASDDRRLQAFVEAWLGQRR